MVQAQALSRYYGDFKAVNNVSFTIQRGEIVGLLGHNGAGKTTIMKMLTGFLEPSTGRILVDSIDIGLNRQFMQSQLGYLPENLPIYPEMIVIDYLDYVASLRGIDPGRRPSAVADVIHQTDMESKAFSSISTLSRGYKQRLGVAQAIIHKPGILILDEPTNGLDPEQIQHMRELIKAMSSETLVILSTHILQEVDAICDRAIIIRQGELIIDAQLDELRSSRQLEIITNATNESMTELISAIQDIESCISIPDSHTTHQHYYLQLGSSGDYDSISSRLAYELTARQFSLYKLSRVERDLESIFRQVNSINKNQVEKIMNEIAHV